ncbi:MAG TPA: nitrate- and nitrite sensing domain-containing protein [Mycobacteriales bacterium]|nr:nitrate- and nitrite sensing domain-containing protein [Mycobacteriales bacterium]
MTPGRHKSAAAEMDQTGLLHAAVGSGPPAAQPPEHEPPRRRSRRFSLALRHWRVRSKLLVILLIPLLAVLGSAGLRLRDVLTSANRAHHAEQVAQLSRQVILVARALEAERDQSARFMGSNRQEAVDTLKSARDATERQIETLRSVRGGIKTGDLGPAVDDLLQTVGKHASKLDGLRQNVDTNGSWPEADSEYRSFVEDLLTIELDIPQGSDDQALNDDVRALVAVSQFIKAVETERGSVAYVIAIGTLPADARTELFRWDAQVGLARTAIDSTLSTEQRAVYDRAVTDALTEPVAKNTKLVLDTKAGDIVPLNVDSWLTPTGTLLTAAGGVEDAFVRQVLDRARELGNQVRDRAILDGSVVLGVLLFTLLLALLTVRSLVRPLRRLRSRALDVAYRELPAAVERMRDSSEFDASQAAFTTMGLDSRDEVGEVAEAFDSVRREAVRHAAEQTQLRQNVSTMFVNLSRRTQSLVERQLRLIDSLEGTERDPDALENLFKLDHLATRMRRNAENLLVLAGSDPGRRWTRPVALIDVLRAAAAEVEQYQRVVHTFVTGREIEGRAVGDVVHLVAELLENATEFSNPETHVVVSARSMSGGSGVMIEIEDQGVGISEPDLVTANDRLSANAEFDPQLSRMMGLYVVGRLAARHGVRVQVRSAPAGGVTALIHLPPEVVVDPMAQTGSELPPLTSPAGPPPAPASETQALDGRETSPTGVPYPAAAAGPLPGSGPAGLTPGLAGGSPPPAGPPVPRGPGETVGPVPGSPAGVPFGRGRQPAALTGPAGAPGRTPAEPAGQEVPRPTPLGPAPPGRPPLPRREPGSYQPIQPHRPPRPSLAGDGDRPGAGAVPGTGQPAGGVPEQADNVVAFVPLLPHRTAQRSDAAPPPPPDPSLAPPPAGDPSATGAAVAAEPVPAGGPAPAGDPPAEPVRTGAGALDQHAEPVDPLTGPVPGRAPVSTGQVDLDEDTIVPHGKDEDLPIFAALESQWFLRRDAEPPPPPPGLPLAEWGISLDDLSVAEPDLAGPPMDRVDVGLGEPEHAGTLPSEGAKLAAAETPSQAEPGRQDSPPALPVRGRRQAGAEPGSPLPGRPPAAEAPGSPYRPEPSGQPAPLAASVNPAAARQPVPPPPQSPWESPSDDGWRAAGRLAAPSSAGITEAGLPIRVPLAHFVPGAAPAPDRPGGPAPAEGQPPPPPAHLRSPEAVRGMLSSYQRGLLQGREAGRHRHHDPDETPFANQEHA